MFLSYLLIEAGAIHFILGMGRVGVLGFNVAAGDGTAVTAVELEEGLGSMPK
jgi:hypothetical protein